VTGWLFLLGAIVAEVIATSALKQVEGLSRPLPLAFTVVGYVIAFSLMSLSLKTIPIGIAYAVWSGVGIRQRSRASPLS
jgi:small multidrug resistance pump